MKLLLWVLLILVSWALFVGLMWITLHALDPNGLHVLTTAVRLLAAVVNAGGDG